jgi:hypothetical protein
MIDHKRKRILVAIFGVTLMVSGVDVIAEIEVRVGAERTDNVARTEADQIEETVGVLGLSMDFASESPRIESSVVSDLEYRNYLDDTFDDEVVGSLFADLSLHVAPRTFSWITEYRFGNIQADPFRPDTAENREAVHSISTGPDLTLRFGSVSAVELSGRYHANRFEESEIDSDVISGRLSFIRGLSPHRSLSLNLTGDSVDYDNAILDSDFKRYAAYLGFESEMSRGSLLVNLGATELEDSAGETHRSTLIDFDLIRELSSSTTFVLAYDQSISDAASSLTQMQAPGGNFGSSQQTPGVSDPFETRRFAVELEFQRGSNSFFVAGYATDNEYFTLSGLDREQIDFRAGFTRTLGSAWRVNLDGGVQNTKFAEVNRKDRDLRVRGGLSRRLSRSLSVNLDVTRFERDSDVAGFDYDETVIGLTFSYTR